MNDEHLSILSEIQELKYLLEATPKEHIIDRMSLEARLEHVQGLLKEFSDTDYTPKARLIFKGQPVLDGHGMLASFGTEASKGFADLFAIVMADLSGVLGNRTKLSNREVFQLRLTGTVVGSFGFEFELPPPSPAVYPFAEPAVREEAIQKITTLLRLSVENDEKDLAEAIHDLHIRATNKISEFLKLLVNRHAWCGLEFKDDSFHYKDYEQIKASHSRFTAISTVEEREVTYRGEFQGILPDERKFEFKLHDKNNPISGRINKYIKYPSILNRKWLNKQVKIKLTVAHPARGIPRYTLMSLDDLSLDDL